MNGRSGWGAMGVSDRLPDSGDGQLELLPMGEWGGLVLPGGAFLHGFPGLIGGLDGSKSGSSGDVERVALWRCMLRLKSAAMAGAKLWASSDEDEYAELTVERARIWGEGSWRFARELNRWKGFEGGEEG